MKQTQNMNVGGYAFIMEEDACDNLEKYIAEVSRAYSRDKFGKEILEDIEFRIAELLLEVKGSSEVIPSEMVSFAKVRIGDPRELEKADDEICGNAAEEGSRDGNCPGADCNCSAADNDGASKTDSDAGHPAIRKRIFRDVENRQLGGVCAGLGHFFSVDPVLFRLVWLILLFGCCWFWDGSLSGVALISYLICWVAFPPALTVSQKCRMRGEPSNLGEFKGYVPESETRVKCRRSGFLRVVCFIAGAILLLVGLSFAVSSVVMPTIPKLMPEVNLQLQGMDLDLGFLTLDNMTQLLSAPFWWILFAMLLSWGLFLGYCGIRLMLLDKSPRVPYGLILAVLSLVSLVALIVYCTGWATGSFLTLTV